MAMVKHATRCARSNAVVFTDKSGWAASHARKQFARNQLSAQTEKDQQIADLNKKVDNLMNAVAQLLAGKEQ